MDEIWLKLEIPDDSFDDQANTEIEFGLEHSPLLVSEESVFARDATLLTRYFSSHNVAIGTKKEENGLKKNFSNASADERHRELFKKGNLSSNLCNGFSYPKLQGMTHNESSLYNCKICSKIFTESYLKYHMRIHVESPYRCNMCDKVFRQTDQLKCHMSIHEKPHKCNTCNKSFTQIGDLNRHVITHTIGRPYECDICNKAFRRNGHLRRHKRTHTDERPYKCNICFKTFRTNGYLKLHMRTHTDERPFRCNICNKAFKHSKSLKGHLITHTSEKSFE